MTLLKGARQLLSPTPLTFRHRRVQLWFGLTLAYTAVVAGFMARTVWGDPYAISDDARQHIFWMLRLIDADLFPNDWIANYYQSVSPVGYSWLYQFWALLGVSPLVLGKLLPAGLMLLTAAIAFLTSLELCAIPAAGFAAAVLLNQSVEYTVTLASGTSKAFVYLLTLLFLYAWLRQSRWLTWLSILLQGLFYPLTVLLTAGLLVLGLVERRAGHWRWRRDRTLRILTLGGLGLSAIVIAGYGLATSEFGPTMSVRQALTMPEFFQGGRTSYFKPDWISYFLYGRSGLRLDTALTPVTNLLALTLPLMLRLPRSFPLVKTVRRDSDILLKLIVVALFWFVAAHALLFKLYLPSRYTGRFLLMVLALGAGIALVGLMDALLQGAIAQLHRRQITARAGGLALLSTGAALGLAIILVLYPLTMRGYPLVSLTQGTAPGLYQFFTTQPKTSMVASLSPETSNLPTFARRSVLVSPEVAIPYHVGYYREIQQRARDLIAAQYSPDPSIVRNFILKYGVTHWLLDAEAFDIQALNQNRWVQQYQPEAGAATSHLANREISALQQIGDRCEVFQTAQHRVIDAQCLIVELEVL